MSGHRVLGDKLKRFRTRAGVTQEQLAQLVDCSDRLIRRAEASLPVRYSTLERIVAALSDLGQCIVPGDLIYNQLAIAKRFWTIFEQADGNWPEYFQYFAKEIQWIEAGEPDKLPFAGKWKGHVQIQRCFDLYQQTFQRQPSVGQPVFLEAERYVTIKFTEQWQRMKPRTSRAEVWGNLHLTFRDGLISRVEHQYDTWAAYRLWSKRA